MTPIGFLRKKLRSKMSIDDIALAFRRDPRTYFEGYGGSTLAWDLARFEDGSGCLDNIYVRVSGEQVAYAHGLLIDPRRHRAEIAHFAIELPYVGRGLGIPFARALAGEFSERWKIRTILFRENSSKYDRFYPNFFRRLGAVERRDIGPTAWEWVIDPPAKPAEAGSQ